MSIKEDFEKAFEAEQSKMKWSDGATDHEKLLVNGNCNRVAYWAAKWAFEKAAQEAEKGIVSKNLEAFRAVVVSDIRQLAKELSCENPQK